MPHAAHRVSASDALTSALSSAGTVAATSPGAGERYGSGDLITLYPSTGKEGGKGKGKGRGRGNGGDEDDDD